MKRQPVFKKPFIRISFILLIIAVIFGVVMFHGREMMFALAYDELSISDKDRVLVLAPHPDDEVLACGGVIQKAVELGIPVKVVFLTYGDSNQWSFIVYRKRPAIIPKAVRAMGMVRHDEAIEADKTLGLTPDQLIFLGYPDFRTLNIWYSRWGDAAPEKSMLTEVRAVPYMNAYRPGAPYKGEEILKDLKSILLEFKPTKIFLSHPGDFNPDHRALYLFTRVALWDLGAALNPGIYPYLIHYRNWPKPKGLNADKVLIPPQIFERQVKWLAYSMSSESVERNLRALKKHKSQYTASAKFLTSFIRTNELFGDFPYVALDNKRPASDLLINRSDLFEELPEELIKEEEENFVGLDNHSLYIDDGALVILVKLSHNLREKTGVSIYVFGYRAERPFAEMPKIHVKLGLTGHKVYDGLKLLPGNSIKITRSGKALTFRIPFDLLENPDRLLTSGRTYFEDVPLDWVSWRVLKIER